MLALVNEWSIASLLQRLRFGCFSPTTRGSINH